MQGRRPLSYQLVFGACIALACSKERPACSPEALAAVEAAYVHEALTTCAGKTAATCPELPAIREKYRGLRKEWETCR